MFAREGEREYFATMNKSPERETFVVEIGRKQRAQLGVIGRKTGIPVELAILVAITRYVEKRRGS